MIDKINDQLSAMLDDELAEQECEMLIARLSKDARLRGVWERYSLISDCMRGSLPHCVAPQLAGRIARTVAAEDLPLKHPAAGRAARWKPAAGIAIAASVAALAIVTLGNPDSTSPNVSTDAASVAAVADEGYTVPVINMREQTSAAMRERLNIYQVSHSEFAGPLQRRAILTQISADAEGLSPDETSGEDLGERQ